MYDFSRKYFPVCVTLAVGAAAPLGIKDKVGEVLLLGFGTEVVVSDAVPLVVEKADKTNNEEERETDSKAGEANYMHTVVLLLRGLCNNRSWASFSQHTQHQAI